MSELQIPRGRYSKKVFWWVVGLSIVAVLTLRFAVIPPVFGTPRPSVGAMLDASLGDILATAFAAVVLSAVVLSLSAPSKKRVQLDVVHPKDINGVLTKALSDARSWHYSGSVGRWNRSDVLPTLAREARQTNTTRSCRLVILDPNDELACKAYADYRGGLNSGAGRAWTLPTVRADICATIVVAAVFKQDSSLLQIEVFLKSTGPIFRIDASDRMLVLTREDKREPAVKCDIDTHFFDSFMETINFDVRQSRKASLWEGAPKPPDLDASHISQILKIASIDIPEKTDPSFIDEVLALAKERSDPYG
jgi:hypothetical protein